MRKVPIAYRVDPKLKEKLDKIVNELEYLGVSRSEVIQTILEEALVISEVKKIIEENIEKQGKVWSKKAIDAFTNLIIGILCEETKVISEEFLEAYKKRQEEEE